MHRRSTFANYYTTNYICLSITLTQKWQELYIWSLFFVHIDNSYVYKYPSVYLNTEG